MDGEVGFGGLGRLFIVACSPTHTTPIFIKIQGF